MATASSARPINPAVTKASIIYFLSALSLPEMIRSQADKAGLSCICLSLDNSPGTGTNISVHNCSHCTAASPFDIVSKTA
jgi:hypothetical protein